MRPLILSLISPSSHPYPPKPAPAIPSPTTAHLPLMLPISATIAQNNATINNAIVQVGSAGGGVICLPAGTFYIGPDPRKSDVAVTINYNNITLAGAGVDKTVLRTNGAYALVNGAVRRGHGILIKRPPPTANRREKT